MYPDIVSYDKIVELTGSFKAPMGCRSFLQGWQDENGQDVVDGRMNLGVVTLNLPRIALESKGDKDKFWQIFFERMAVMKDALVYRVERVKEATPANAPSFMKMVLLVNALAEQTLSMNCSKIVVRRFLPAILGYMKSQLLFMVANGI
jgi:anaerobic ribonucleoside-triphosphate reductase